MKRALLVLVVTAALIGGAIETTAGGAARTRIACGVERWSVKTLQGRPRLLPVRTTTIRYLVTRPAPRTRPDTRLPFERHVYTIAAAVTLVRPEDDGDLHLVLRDGPFQMLGESPDPGGIAGARATRRAQMRTARGAVKFCRRAQVSGVAFFDFKHGQTGVAANAIELHPVLKFGCLTG